nr:unnamed protein product [Callosobruchus analis]
MIGNTHNRNEHSKPPKTIAQNNINKQSTNASATNIEKDSSCSDLINKQRSIMNSVINLENDKQNSTATISYISYSVALMTDTVTSSRTVKKSKNISPASENKHGGSVVFVGEEIVNSSERLDIVSQSEMGNLECSAVEIRLHNMKMIILSIYRPPLGMSDVFLNNLEHILMGIYNEEAVLIIAGDFNIDFSTDNQRKNEVCSLLNSYDLQQMIFVLR